MIKGSLLEPLARPSIHRGRALNSGKRAIYNDLSRGHPKWWFSKGIPPKMALN